jgi:hypothetical protein
VRREPAGPLAGDRLRDALDQLYVAARHQLGVPNPADMSDPSPWSDDPWRSQGSRTPAP